MMVTIDKYLILIKLFCNKFEVLYAILVLVKLIVFIEETCKV